MEKTLAPAQAQPPDQQGHRILDGRPIALTDVPPWDDQHGFDDSGGRETTGYPTLTESEKGEDLVVLPETSRHPGL